MHPGVDELVVVLPESLVTAGPSLVGPTTRPCLFVAGGERRQDSVRLGFAALSARVDPILVHDAARPFADIGLIETINAEFAHGNLRDWAVFTHSALRVMAENQLPQLTDEVAAAVFELRGTFLDGD